MGPRGCGARRGHPRHGYLVRGRAHHRPVHCPHSQVVCRSFGAIRDARLRRREYNHISLAAPAADFEVIQSPDDSRRGPGRGDVRAVDEGERTAWGMAG